MLRKIFVVFYLTSFFFLLISFATPIPAHAQSWSRCLDANGVATLQCIPIVFSNVVTAALEFVGTVAVILIVYGGIRFVTSGGDSKQVQAARQIITYAIIGLVVVLFSFGIIFLISYLTNAKCITTFSFTSCK